MTDDLSGRRSKPTIPDSARDAIGRRLRESLDRIVAEPVPDRFLRLLDALEADAPSRARETEPDAEA